MTAGAGVEGLLRELAPHGPSAPWSAATGTSTPARSRTPCRRPSWRPPRGAAGRVAGQPRGWLVTVASRRLTEQFRSESARRPPGGGRRRPGGAGRRRGADEAIGGRAGGATIPSPCCSSCCHPSLSPPSQVALTLRAVGGLTTAEVARAFLVPESTMGQRISRAEATVPPRRRGHVRPAAAGGRRSDRLAAVLKVLYLVFNGATPPRRATTSCVDLTAEAVGWRRSAPSPAGRPGGRRPARPHAVDRGAAAGPDPARRCTGPARRAGPVAVAPRPHRGRRPHHPHAAGGAGGAVPGAGRHRRRPRRGGLRGGHRLAQVLALYGVLERIAPSPSSPSTGRWPWPWSRPEAGLSCWPRSTPTAGPPPPPPLHRPRPPARTGQRRGRPGRLPDRSPAHHQPARTAAPGGLRRPSGGGQPAPPAPASTDWLVARSAASPFRCGTSRTRARPSRS